MKLRNWAISAVAMVITPFLCHPAYAETHTQARQDLCGPSAPAKSSGNFDARPTFCITGPDHIGGGITPPDWIDPLPPCKIVRTSVQFNFYNDAGQVFQTIVVTKEYPYEKRVPHPFEDYLVPAEFYSMSCRGVYRENGIEGRYGAIYHSVEGLGYNGYYDYFLPYEYPGGEDSIGIIPGPFLIGAFSMDCNPSFEIIDHCSGN